LESGKTGEMMHYVATLLVPSAILRPDVNVLKIVCPTWCPRDYGVSADTRDLGIMLHSVSAERAGH